MLRTKAVVLASLVLVGTSFTMPRAEAAAAAERGTEVSADFNNDGFADVAIGVPGENVGAIADAGAVTVLYGAAGGLSAAGNQFWHQNVAGVTDVAETGDRFGSALTAANLGRTLHADLAIGVPGENVGAIADAGAVTVLYGAAGGLSAAGNQFWHQNVAGVTDIAETGDQFGAALAAAI
jgi:disulfide bond formation protein DsbB